MASPLFLGSDHGFRHRGFCHLTTAEAWQGIAQSGMVEATRENVVKHLQSADDRRLCAEQEQTGVFTIDPDNFSRRWLCEGAAYPDGTVSSGDYHLRRFTRRVARDFARKDALAFDAMQAPWAEVCRFLKNYRDEPALALVALPGHFDDGEILVRDHSHMYSAEPPPDDGNYDHRFRALLSSVRTLFQWEREPARPDHSWEFIIPRNVRVSEGVRLEKMLSVRDVLSMFTQNAHGDKGKVDPEQVRRLLVNA